MKIIITIIIFLITLTSTSQELSVSEIKFEVEKINSDLELSHHIFDTNKIYKQTTDGGGTFEIWTNNGKIKKITQSVFLSNGLFVTTFYLKNNQPILISETEKHFQLTEDNSGFDYDKELVTNYSEVIYTSNWENDAIKIKSKGKSLRKEPVSGISDYWGLLETAKKVLP